MTGLAWAMLVQVAVAAPPPPLVVRVDEERRPVPAVVGSDGVRAVPLDALARALDAEIAPPAFDGAPWRLRVDRLWVEVAEAGRWAVSGLDTLPLPGPVERRGDTVYVPEALATEVLPALGAGVVLDAAAGELLRIALRPAPPAAMPPPDPGAGRRRVVVVDPGHGGRDAGMVGMRVNGRTLVEKQVTLAVAQALREALEARGVEVVLTRTTDVLVPLAERGGIANRARGDLFLSLHVNAASPEWSSPGGVRGHETYVLAEARTDAQRLVEARENAAVRFEGEAAEGGGEALAFVMRDLEQNAHRRASAELAALMQMGMQGVHPGPARGVQQAGFRVLRTAAMPAVLVEMGYGSHPGDAAFLADPAQQRRLARALADAALRFLDRYPVASVGGAR